MLLPSTSEESALGFLGDFLIICLLVEYIHQNFVPFYRDEKILEIKGEILIFPAKRSKELLEAAEKRNGLRYFEYFIKNCSESGWNMCKGHSQLQCFEMWGKSEGEMPPLWPLIRMIIHTADFYISEEPYKSRSKPILELRVAYLCLFQSW